MARFASVVEATIIEPDHEEDYDSDHMPARPQDKNRLHSGGGLGERRLSRVEDNRLRAALGIIRSGSQRELKEECVRNEWYTVCDETERDILKDCVIDEVFWDEVKDLARKEIEAEPEIMGEEQFRKMFREFDADQSGAIDAEELRKLLQQAMGMDCTHEEVIDLMMQVDTDGNGEIDEQEFLDIMNAAKKQQESSGYRAQKEKLDDETVLGKQRKTRRESTVGGPPEVVERSAARSGAGRKVTLTAPGEPTSRGYGSDDSDENVKPSTRLRRKASYTKDKTEKATLLGKATVEEYKEMLKTTASAARRGKAEPTPPAPEVVITSPVKTPTSTTSQGGVFAAPGAGAPAGGAPISISAAMKSSNKPRGGYSAPATKGSPKEDEIQIQVTSAEPRQESSSTHSTEPCEEIVEQEVRSSPVPKGAKKKTTTTVPRPAATTSSSGTSGSSSVPSYMRNTAASKPKTGRR